MKTIKRKFLLPVAVFMIAIAAAFATQSDGQEDYAPQNGYIYQNEACVLQRECSTFPTTPCTHNGVNVFGKTGKTSCIQPLYMP